MLISTLGYVVMQASTPIVVEGEMLRKKDPSTVVVCKQTARTNTRFAKRTCKTRADWDLISEQAKRDAKEMFHAPRPNMCGADSCP